MATDTTPAPAPAVPQRPDDCPDAAKHAPLPRPGDYRQYRYHRCPSCGFWALLAPAAKPGVPR